MSRAMTPAERSRPAARAAASLSPQGLPGLALVADALASVEARLASLATGSEPPLPDVTAHLLGSGGKRIRPLVLLLAARSQRLDETPLTALACAAELVHTATLLHDDVVDAGDTRRRRPAAHRLWGNAMAVLAGDFCLALCLTELASVADPRPVASLSHTVKALAEGEVLQLNHRGVLDLSPDYYRAVVERKTASLMAWCATVGGLLPPAADRALRAYGLALGLAFQMADDVLDYAGDPQVTGKDVGSDLREGKPTLPLVEACRRDAALQAQVEAYFAAEHPDPAARRALTEAVRRGDALAAARDQAAREAEAAVRALAALPAGPEVDALAALARFSADRSA